MTRRLAASLIGLALMLPVFAVAPVKADIGAGWSIEWGSLWNDDGETVWGIVTNHLSARRSSIQVTATWEDGDGDVMATVTQPAMVSNLAAHSSSPFEIFQPDAQSAWILSVTVSASSNTITAPVGGLSVRPGDFVSGDVYEGEITNDGSVAAQNVKVYGIRRDGIFTDAAASATIASIAPGATATYSITFDGSRPGDVRLLVAQTTGAVPFLTSWNNYFGDLGTSSFAEEIGWMASEGITTGCGNASFCPKDSVTRGQMAVFLARALDLGDTSPAGFTDIGHLTPLFQDSINAVANAGISGGCATSPLRYCPSQAVTRGQMSKFIVVGFGEDRQLTPIDGLGSFTDDNFHFSEPYNNAMAQNAITSGCAPSRFCPNASVTREQMAVFMKRASELPLR